MSLKPKALSLEEQRAELELRANLIRSRLLRTIDVLDKRRHQVQTIRRNAKRLAMPVGAAFVGMVILSATTVLVVRAIVRGRRERRLGYRIARALEPLRVQRRPSFWSQALSRVSLTALGVVAGELARRGVRQVLLAPGASSEEGQARSNTKTSPRSLPERT